MLLLLALACTPETPETPDLWVPPDEGGWYDVWTQRSEADARGGEVLPVQIWAPARDVGTSAYSYDGVLEGDAFATGIPRCAEPRPAVAFSHGNGGLRYQSIFLTERLASRGFVVFAPDHVGNTAADFEAVPRDVLTVRRPADIADSFDHLIARATDPQDELYGCIDPEAGYAMTGHSFGGYTTFATAGARLDLVGMDERCPNSGWLCGAQDVYRQQYPGETSGDLSDDRVWAAVPLAPAGRWAVLPHTVEVPVMVLGGLQDRTTTWNEVVEPMYQELTTEPRYLGALDQVGHYSFSDFCIDPTDGCGAGFLPPQEAQEIVNVLTTAFLETTLGEDRSLPWLPHDHPSITWTQSP